MTLPVIETGRLVLRALTMADWEPYAAMWADPRVTTFIGGEPRPRPLAWAKFGQAVAMDGLLGYGKWAVVDAAGGAFFGICGFADYQRGIAELDGCPECGWAFVAECWGRGIASEAVGAAVGWADRAGIAETRCMIDRANIASARVAERCGYAAFGELPDDRRVFRRQAPSA